MESLLSLAFDNLTSYDTGKVRKGLRQVDGLLAQICLSRATSTSTGTPGPGGGGTPGTKMTAAEKRRSAMMLGASSPATTMTTSTKELGTLKEDPAFREFFKLQDGFEWNGTSGPYQFVLARNRDAGGNTPDRTCCPAVACPTIGTEADSISHLR